MPGLGALGYLRPFMAACASWSDVTLLDVPGFGHRKTSRCPSGLGACVRAVGGWLDTQDARNVVLMGHSTGAQIAAHVAALYPERTMSLVLLGPTFPPPARRWSALAAATLRTIRHETVRLVPATFPEYLRGRRRVAQLLRSAMADPIEETVQDVACPVLVVRGAHDALSPAEWCQALAAGAANGVSVTVPGAHNFLFDHAVEATRVVQRWTAAQR